MLHEGRLADEEYQYTTCTEKAPLSPAGRKVAEEEEHTRFSAMPESGITSLQRISRAKKQKKTIAEEREAEWQHFLEQEALALEKLLGDEELDETSALPVTSTTEPVTKCLTEDNTPLSSSQSRSTQEENNEPTDSNRTEDAAPVSRGSSDHNIPITVHDMLFNDSETGPDASSARTEDEISSQEALQRCRIEAEEVFERTYLDMKKPHRGSSSTPPPPLSIVERDERHARKQLKVAEQSFRNAIRDFREADRNYIYRQQGKKSNDSSSSPLESESAPSPMDSRTTDYNTPADEAPRTPDAVAEEAEEDVVVPAENVEDEERDEKEEPQTGEEEDVCDDDQEDDGEPVDAPLYEEPGVEEEEEPEPEVLEPHTPPARSSLDESSLANRPETSVPHPPETAPITENARNAIHRKKEEKVFIDAPEYTPREEHAFEESPYRVRDEVFPGAHAVMMNVLYEAYGLLPSNQYRMTLIDFFDSVSAVGATLNMNEYDETMPYRPDKRSSFTSETWSVPSAKLWVDEHLFSYVDTCLDQQAARKKANQRRERHTSLDGRGLFAPYYADNGKQRENRSVVDWIVVKDLCMVLVNGLGSAYVALREKETDIVTEDHIKDWTLQFIHYGLQRLLRDQMGAHTVTFRSVFSLLCPSSRRRLTYSVFETIFLSQVSLKQTLNTIQLKTNIDYGSSFMKRQGVTYLPFALFLRQLCTQVRGISLLKLREILETIMQPSTSVKLIRFARAPMPIFPVHLARRGVDCLASMSGAWQTFVKFLEVEPRNAPTARPEDKTAEDLLKVVVQNSSLDVATHTATKCLLILMLFVNWMETDFREVEEGVVDVRFWTQRVFSEANAYYRIAQNPSSEEDQKCVCADVVALFYTFFDTKLKEPEFLRYVKNKEVAKLDAVSTLRQQISDSLQVQSEGPSGHGGSLMPNVVSDDENFVDRPDGPLLLRRLVNTLIGSVGAIFFSYDSYVDGVVTFYSKEQVGNDSHMLDANSYKAELARAKNPFREMDAVTFYTRTFNRMVEKTMGYLQALWAGTRWLRSEVQLCTTGHIPVADPSAIPRSFSQCASLLADCILAGWPHQRRERIPFRRVPRRGSVAQYSKMMDEGKQWDREDADDKEDADAHLGTRNDFDVTHRSIDSMFADLVITNEPQSTNSSMPRSARPVWMDR